MSDSYTIGESVEASQRWPVQLADTLQQAGIKIGNPKIIAKTGWTTTELPLCWCTFETYTSE